MDDSTNGEQGELLAAVIVLEADQALPPWPGRAAQAWLLDSIRAVDPALADTLHGTDAHSQRRPYTVSVMPRKPEDCQNQPPGAVGSDKGEQGTGTARSGHPQDDSVVRGLSEPERRVGSDKSVYRNQYCLRVTSLSADLTSALTGRLFAATLAHGSVRLGGTEAEVKAVQMDGNGWTGRSSFEALARQCLTPSEIPDRPINGLSWEFATPTAFHHSGLTIPLPLPSLVFGSLIHAWDQFSLLPMPVTLHAFVDRQVGIARHRIATRIVHFGKKEQHIGFVGTATYRFLAERSGLSPDEFHQRVRMLVLLAAFAFYAGVGIRTAAGMGQVRATPE